VDGTLSATDFSSPYSFSLNTIPLSNGTHVLSAKAYDASGNIGTSASISVTISNSPEVLTTALVPSATSGVAPITISITASVGGTAQGTINYIFYCNRSDLGTNITSPADLTVNAVSTTSYLATNLCTYQTPGSYTAKVIAERGSASPAQAEGSVTVNEAQATVPSGGGGSSGGGGGGGGSGGGYVPPHPASGGGGYVPIPTPTPTPSSPSIQPVFPRPLSFGNTGSDVTLLQTVLKNLGFFNATTTITAYFGTFTQHAVILFQDAHQLNKSGFLDTPTTALLDKVVSANTSLAGGLLASSNAATTTPVATIPGGQFLKNLYFGSTGAEVTLLQKTLFADGDYPQDLITGYYGNLTTKAVQAFQTKHGVISYGTPDTTGYGAVGPRTRRALDAASP
jgi:peptidoglycan hydrolase-like protein with peptidoglycan-binding domain